MATAYEEDVTAGIRARPVAASVTSPEILQLRDAIAALESRLGEHRRKRRRSQAMTAVGLSLVLHCLLLAYLAVIHRAGGGGGGAGESVLLELSSLPDTGLVQPAQGGIEALTPQSDVPLAELAQNPPLTLSEAGLSSESLNLSRGGNSPGELIGSGQGAGGGGGGGGEGEGMLGGGAGGTSFFGISSKGTRFAYIVDRSMSMAAMSKLEIAKRELARSVDSLPDYASFMVVFFSNDLLIPDMQDGWLRANKGTIRRFTAWMTQVVAPSGGTVPGPAFLSVFSLPVRPDVVFFMTDGEITNFSAEDIAALNRHGKHVVVNTIAFGDPSSQDLLKQIARESGGVYRFVPTEGW